MSATERLMIKMKETESMYERFQEDKRKPLIQIGLKFVTDLAAKASALRTAVDSFKAETDYLRTTEGSLLLSRAEALLSTVEEELAC